MKHPLNLVFTIAIDGPGETIHRMMAKLMISSLFRTGYAGDILVFTNSPFRLFEYPRRQLREICIEMKGLHGPDLASAAQKFKYATHSFFRPVKYTSILYVDSDCLFLKDPEPLFRSPSIITFAEEPFSKITNAFCHAFLTDDELSRLNRPGVNSGVWRVRSDQFIKMMTLWERIDKSPPIRHRFCADQSSWTRLLLDAGPGVEPFRLGIDICYPLFERRTSIEMLQATILHYNGPGISPKEKLSFMYGTYMQHCQPEMLAAIQQCING